MIFLKAENWDDNRHIVVNIKYIVSIAETEHRRSTRLEIFYGKDTYYHSVDRNSIKFLEIKTPEDANDFLSEEDMEI